MVIFFFKFPLYDGSVKSNLFSYIVYTEIKIIKDFYSERFVISQKDIKWKNFVFLGIDFYMSRTMRIYAYLKWSPKTTEVVVYMVIFKKGSITSNTIEQIWFLYALLKVLNNRWTHLIKLDCKLDIFRLG